MRTIPALKGGVLKNAVRFWYPRGIQKTPNVFLYHSVAFTFAFLDSKVALKSGVLKNAVRFWYHSVALDPATFE